MNKKLCIFLFLLALGNCFPQAVYTPVESSVYPFLDRMNLKDIITLNDEVRPYTRKSIAEYLIQIINEKEKLNEIEKEDLNWECQEFKNEMTMLKSSSKNIHDSLALENIKERWYALRYSDSRFSLRVSPLLTYTIERAGSNSNWSRSWGVHAYGSFGKHLGFDLNMADNGEYGNNLDYTKKFSSEAGRSFYKATTKTIEYSDVRGAISLSWPGINLSLQKDYVNWGHGRFGQLILSGKSPSFPMIKFEMKPVDWLRFYYVHGWLNSQVLDSMGLYFSSSSVFNTDNEKFVKKYYVANFFCFSPYKWLDLSIGNSLVYKGDLRAEMFIPFLFFKYLDRDLGQGSIEDGNGAFFLDFNFKYFKNWQLYSSLFVDCLSISKTLNNDWYENWLAFTIGGKRIDAFINNLDVTAEYTRIYPWVYEHKDPVTTYKHLNYSLGHWIGQNADQLHLQIDYKPAARLKITAWIELLHKGDMDSISVAYKTKTTKPFLYGKVRNDTYFGFEATYEYLHDLGIKAFYKYSDITDEDKTRTPSSILGKQSTFGVSVNYGM